MAVSLPSACCTPSCLLKFLAAPSFNTRFDFLTAGFFVFVGVYIATDIWHNSECEILVWVVPSNRIFRNCACHTIVCTCDLILEALFGSGHFGNHTGGDLWARAWRRFSLLRYCFCICCSVWLVTLKMGCVCFRVPLWRCIDSHGMDVCFNHL